MPADTIFRMTGSTVRFGTGATREVGAEFVDLGCRRVLVIADPAIRDSYPGQAAEVMPLHLLLGWRTSTTPSSELDGHRMDGCPPSG